ncbi:MAG: molybdenum cofactor guanylyltransferase [Actinomycetota bacterium]
MGTGEGFDAIILAGGRAERMGGIDKPALEIGGMTLLSRAVAAAAGARKIVVLGPRRADDLETDSRLIWTREEPPGGGPVAAVAAGLDRVSAERVALLAADLPAIDADALGRLLAPLEDAALDGVLGVDDAGRDQYLCAVYRSAALRRRLDADPTTSGASMRSLLEGLRLGRIPLGARARDVDTPADLR